MLLAWHRCKRCHCEDGFLARPQAFLLYRLNLFVSRFIMAANNFHPLNDISYRVKINGVGFSHLVCLITVKFYVISIFDVNMREVAIVRQINANNQLIWFVASYMHLIQFQMHHRGRSRSPHSIQANRNHIECFLRK